MTAAQRERTFLNDDVEGPVRVRKAEHVADGPGQLRPPQICGRGSHAVDDHRADVQAGDVLYAVAAQVERQRGVAASEDQDPVGWPQVGQQKMPELLIPLQMLGC